MKKILFFFFMVLFTTSCLDKESWTISPDARLAFSSDTIRFDTLISTVPSSTRTLYVYNKGKSGIRLSQVKLAKGAESLFRANVDGEVLYEGVGFDFEIPAKDSLIVRLEVTLPETSVTTPVAFEEHLDFTLESGVLQRICLSASAQDAYIHHGLVVQKDTVFSSDKPIVIYDSLVVEEGVSLTLSEGTVLMFHDQAGMDVRGRLVAEGSIARPVVFRGDRTDRLFPYLPYDNTPGRWNGIRFYGNSSDNSLVHCDIHSACYGIVCDSAFVEDVRTLTLHNSIVHNISGDGLQLNDCKASITNTQISNTKGITVHICGGDYEFIHCTIAQFYPFVADRGHALFFTNQKNGIYHDLVRCHFDNCVLTGYGEDVIMGDITEGQDYACDYRFLNCYLNTVASTDTVRFVRVLYDTESQPLLRGDNFLKFDTENFLYDFTPDSLSSIRGLADTAIAKTLPFDCLGRSRFVDSSPDAGCYEFIEQTP